MHVSHMKIILRKYEDLSNKNNNKTIFNYKEIKKHIFCFENRDGLLKQNTKSKFIRGRNDKFSSIKITIYLEQRNHDQSEKSKGGLENIFT